MSNFLLRRKKLSLLLLGAISVSMVAAFPFFKSTQLQDWFASTSNRLSKEVIAVSLQNLVHVAEFPENVDIQVGDEVIHSHLKYTLDNEAQAYINSELRRYRPDYAAFVAMDARTGRILAMASFQRDGQSLGNLALKTSFPAASVFKVVTATAAIDQKKLTADSRIPFNGANHTLYKRNVVGDQPTNRWTRDMSIREAFAKSVNSVFGKIGIVHVGSQGLREYANRFMFNQTIRADFPALMGFTTIQDGDDFKLAEAASGFTRTTTMSPIQGALIAAAVANDGVMMEPALIDNITNNAGEIIYQSQPSIASVTMNSASAMDMRTLMQSTVSEGTSRQSFHKIWKIKDMSDDIELGGKTGSHTGLEPRGRYNWFIGYMRYKDQKIAVSALTIDGEKWRVKSAFLASEFLLGLMKGHQKVGKIFGGRKLKARDISSQ